MNLVKQLVLGGLAIVVTFAIWAIYVPSAAPYLDRIGFYNLIGIDPPAVEEDQARGFGDGATQVVVAPATAGQVNARVSAIGDGRAAQTVTIRSVTTGIISDLPIAPGSYVEQGALVAQMDDAAEQIAVERARLMLTDVTDEFDRISQLGSSGTVAGASIRAAELALRTAELEVEQAEFDLQQRRITAPISGWVGLLDAGQGDRIGAQEPIAVITDRSSLQIDFRVPERYINDLSIGMVIDVTPLSRPDQVMQGEIAALDNVVDRASRTLRVQGRLDNEDDRLRAGQAFSVSLSFPGEDLPAVDPLAIQWAGDGSYIWVAEEDEARRVPVTIRQRNSDSVVVEGDLSPGDLVIIEGVQNLRPGAPVDIVTDTAVQTGSTAQNGALREL
ncbi:MULTISPECIES: efflux RND transporter periplasmic adaptor subunit [unclassified Yoonia]|uniref:efflux RND transporter periplasmic adaptor subunit n=1 Tax=unclassified Yoonia TaxID=2629118 RepID=UPI002AFE4163|nr:MULTISPECIES: efflux RND transporter periplasmic adaptor subunit [unclassified Yoonia]